MRDKRRVDELSIEELERVLAMRKREERMKRLERMKRTGRVIEDPKPTQEQPTEQPATEPSTDHSLDDIIANIASNPTNPRAASKPRPKPQPQAEIRQEVALVEDDEPLPVRVNTPVQKQKNPKILRRATNNLLLLVEVAAVFGLLYLGWELLQGIVILEETSAEAQAAIEEANARTIPTIEPTPMLSLNQVVLPGGHKWVEGQTPTLNIDEIPENIRFAVADQILRPVINRPPPTDETALRLIIPRLNVDQSIVQGSDWEALKQGVGQVLNGYDPTDANGNVALTAHNDIYGELFRHLDQLEPGDQFQIQTRTQVHLYEVSGWEVVDPTDVHVLNSTGRATATLISCYPYRVNTKRIVVFADRIG